MKIMDFKPKEQKPRGQSVTLWIPRDQVTYLDKIAKKVGTTRAEIIRQSIHFAVENMKKK